MISRYPVKLPTQYVINRTKLHESVWKKKGEGNEERK